MSFEDEVSNLVGATTELLEAVNVKKTELDSAVAAAEQVVVDLASVSDGTGAAMVGYDGSTVQAVLDGAKSIFDYPTLRSYTGRATHIHITQSGIAGYFYRDAADTTSSDNGGTVIVDGSGRRWKRLFNGKMNVEWFGAVKGGVADNLPPFNAASAAASLIAGGLSGDIEIPAGTWLLSGPVTTGANWHINGAATISGQPTVGSETVPIHDTSYLTGRVVDYRAGSAATLRVGDPDPWLTKLWRPISECIATFTSINDKGRPAGLFATRTSGNSGGSALGYALSATCVNDKVDSTVGGWTAYFETYREALAGNTFGLESDFINLGNAVDLGPYTNLYTGLTTNLWISCGGGSTPHSVDAQDISAAICILPNSKGFKRGIVFRANSVTGSDIDAIATPSDYKWGWYSSDNSKISYIDSTEHSRTVITDTLTDCVLDTSSRRRSNLTATLAGTVLYRHNYLIHNGTSYMTGGYDQVEQETNFASGTARISRVLAAHNIDGTTATVAINKVGSNTVTPGVDNTMSFGQLLYRWKEIFSTVFRPGDGSSIWTSGSGSPEGVLSAGVGSLYTDKDGSSGAVLYVKETGTGNTGWVAK